jgi:phospholipid/cholesterol/gamma-HCH transport system ATP-binding protein
MVFQNGALFDSLSVGENIAFPLREKGGLQEDQIQQLVPACWNWSAPAIPSTCCHPASPPAMKRCVAIARALAAQPEAILYDEPTTMVDPIMGRRIGDLIQRLKLQLGITSIVVTHDMRFAIRLADLVLFLESGKARFFGTIREFVECTDPHVQQFFALDAYVLPQPPPTRLLWSRVGVFEQFFLAIWLFSVQARRVRFVYGWRKSGVPLRPLHHLHAISVILKM